MATFTDPVLARLAASLPDTIPVVPWARTIDPPATPVLMARLDAIAPVSAGQWRATVTLVLIGATSNPSDLEAPVASVIDALETGVDGVTWTAAASATWADTLPAFTVTTTAVLNKE